MRPNARQLALRDPAAAMLFGVVSGADFGAESDWGSETDVGAEGDDFGADFGLVKAAPTAAQLVALHHRTVAASQKSNSRAALLDPNRGSNVKVERYSFGLSQPIIIGTPVAINLSGNPSVRMRPQRIVTNVPGPNFVYINLIQVANVVVTVGSGVEDANDYSAHAVGTDLDLPTLSTQTPARVSGSYLGFVPTGYVAAAASFFTTSFKGWATL